MRSLPNILSFLRAPLALLFIQTNPYYRASAILLAMLTDGLDGFLARKYRLTSRFGTVLDPIMDKFFVIFVLSTFLLEGRLTLLQASAMLCRDFSVMLFGIYLLLSSKFSAYQFRAIWCGKATTFLQFGVLLALCFGVVIPTYFFAVFLLLGVLALFELYSWTPGAKIV